MSTVETLLVALIMVFTVPYLIWRIGRTDYFAPLVVVQIVAGIVLGPGMLGAAFPGYYRFVFNAPVIDALNGIASWAVMLFVWIAGIELDLRQAWVRRGESAITASFALAAPFALGSLVALAMVRYPGWTGAKGNDLQMVLGIGMACAVTALPILVLLMEKLEILRQPLGQRVLRYAAVDDLAIWAALALILLDWQRVGRQGAFLVLFTLAAWLLRKLMRRVREGDRWHIGLIWLATCGFLADWSGLHFMVGAFLAGAVLDAEWFDRARIDAFRNFVLLAVMPVFFLSTGLKTQWGNGGVAVLAVAAALLAASVFGKLAGVRFAGRLLGWQKGEAAIIGWLLQTKALIMIIFANILLDRQIISGATFTALLLMAVGSTMLTVPAVTPRLKALAGLTGKTR